MPKGFPNGWGRTEGSPTKRTLRSRMSGPVGAFALHASLLFLLFHFNAMREVFGQRAADELDWTWLPEVTLVASTPEEPPPPEPPPQPPEPEIAPEDPPPPEPAPEEVPAALPEEPEPQPQQIEEPESAPESPPMAAEVAATTNQPDAWTEVRDDILKSLRYPARARHDGVSGVAVLLLKLNASGQLVSAEIQPPAPALSLCHAALAAARRVGPFPKLGEAIRRGAVPAQAEIAIRFELERSIR